MNFKTSLKHGIFKVTTAVLLAAFTSSVQAEYYVSCGGPDYVECVSCVKCVKRHVVHHKYKYVKHRKHRPAYALCSTCTTQHPVKRSRATINVYYIQNINPAPCMCGDAWAAAPACGCRRVVQEERGFVVFAPRTMPVYDGYYYTAPVESSYYYDRGTADDDSYVYPDMDIDH